MKTLNWVVSFLLSVGVALCVFQLNNVHNDPPGHVHRQQYSSVHVELPPAGECVKHWDEECPCGAKRRVWVHPNGAVVYERWLKEWRLKP